MRDLMGPDTTDDFAGKHVVVVGVYVMSLTSHDLYSHGA